MSATSTPLVLDVVETPNGGSLHPARYTAAWGGRSPMERRASQCLRSQKQVGTPDAHCGNVRYEGVRRHDAGIASCPPPYNEQIIYA